MEEKTDIVLGTAKLGESVLTSDTFYMGLIFVGLFILYLGVSGLLENRKKNADK